MHVLAGVAEEKKMTEGTERLTLPVNNDGLKKKTDVAEAHGKKDYIAWKRRI